VIEIDVCCLEEGGGGLLVPKFRAPDKEGEEKNSRQYEL